MEVSLELGLHYHSATFLHINFICPPVSGQTPQSLLFQCQPSSRQSGQVFIPNIPDAFFQPSVPTNLSTAREGLTYILTIPPPSPAERDCSGRVVAIEYCYVANPIMVQFERTVFLFDFLVLNRESRLSFRVVEEITVQSTPSRTICQERSTFDLVCCDVTTIRNEELFVSQANFTFGITVLFLANLIAFPDTAMEYNADYILTNPIFSSNFQVTESNFVSARSLPLVRLFVGMLCMLST